MIVAVETIIINRKKMTGIGSQEAELITTIDNSGLKVFSVAAAAKLLGFSNTMVSQIVHRSNGNLYSSVQGANEENL
jgi:molybdenum-dependent DNA-binding transcriptional regulator ModE